MSNIHFSSETDLWSTPVDFFKKLDSRFNFTLDPCATKNNAKCDNFFTIEEDGLGQKWSGRVFMNPPYGRRIGLWMEKARHSVEQGDCELVVCLVPSQTDTRWFWDNVFDCEFAKIEFIKGRLKFGGQKNSAPFPSAIIIYRQ